METFRDTHDADGGEGILAFVVRHGGLYPPGVVFHTEPSSEVQLATIVHPKGKAIKRHLHPRKERIVTGTNEVLIVVRGEVQVHVYNSRRQHCGNTSLLPGDVVVFVAGGHSFYMSEASQLIEVKQGPYFGPEADKVHW